MRSTHSITTESATQYGTAAVAALLGAAFFFLVFDPRILDPTFIGWLTTGDRASHYVGWAFFRQEPWGIPLGKLERLGMGMAGSVVNTDSIPLFAMLFKTVSPWLPANFQYTGLWILCCYMLQGLGGWLIAKQLTPLRSAQVLISLCFILSPTMIERVGGHFALVGHWTLLFALALYLHTDVLHRGLLWRLLLGITILVNGYLFYLTGAIWLADVLRERFVLRRQRPATIWLGAVTTVFAVAVVMWVSGWLALPLGHVHKGTYYGQFAADLTSLWNPVYGALFIQGWPGRSGEGYSYLGAGVLLALIIAALFSAIRSDARHLVRDHWPLGLMALVFALLALTNKVAFGEKVILEWPLPGFLSGKLDFIRASGRLLWLGGYTLAVLAFAIIARSLPARAALALIAIATAVQVADLTPKYRLMHGLLAEHVFNPGTSWQSPLVSPFWTDAAKRYTTILYVPRIHIPPKWEPIALYAASNRLQMNTGYFSRVNGNWVGETSQVLLADIAAGRFDPSALYMLPPEGPLPPFKMGDRDAFVEVDGYRMIAPQWKAEQPAK